MSTPSTGSPVKRDPPLDGIRALAAVAVLIFHVGFNTGLPHDGLLGQLVTRLDWGVTVFFVLSGFLLSRPFIRATLGGPPVSRRVYAERRALRILPLYWLVLAAVLLVHSGAAPPPATVISTALLLQPYTDSPPVPGFEQAWSVATEAAFYLLLPLFPLVAVRPRPRDPQAQVRRWWWWCAAFAAVGFAATWWSWRSGVPNPVLSATWLLQLTPWFAGGILLAVHREAVGAGLRGWPLLSDIGRSPAACWALAAAVFALSATLVAGSHEPLAIVDATQVMPRRVLYLVAAILIVLPAAVPRASDNRSFVLAALSWRWLRHLGVISYGVFLWHLLALDLALRVLDRPQFAGGFWLVLLVTSAFTLLLAEMTWRALEQPLLRRSHRRSLARAATSPAPSAR